MARRITRRALGRSGQLGDLYDARADDFLTGNIFGNNLPASVVELEDRGNVDFKFDRKNNYSSTFENLQMEAELKLNILSGILKVEGRGKYMSNISQSSNSHKITLSLFITKKLQKLQVSYKELDKYICHRGFLNPLATHVVTEVLWGANIFAIFEQQKSSRDERETIEGELAAKLKKAGPLLKGEAEANLEAIGENTSNVNNLHIEFTGDMEMTGVPTTISEALKMIKTIPASIAQTNGGKGVQVQFTLSPIRDVLQFVESALPSPLETMIMREVNNGLVQFIEHTFDESLLLQQKVQQVLALAAKYRDVYLHKNEVRRMNLEKIDMDVAADKFRRTLARLLKQLRTSATDGEEENLDKTITDLVRQHYHDESEKTDKFLSDHKTTQKKCEVIERLTSLGVECVPISDEFRESPDKEVYILITNDQLLKTDGLQSDPQYKEFLGLINRKKNARFVLIERNNSSLSTMNIEHRPQITSSNSSASRDHDQRKPCKWGTQCRSIKDSEHRKQFSHHPPNQNREHDNRQVCKWGGQCWHIKDIEHRKQFSHHPPNQNQAHDKRQTCKWDLKCTDHSEHHRAKYAHSRHGQNEDNKQTHQLQCKWGAKCTDYSNDHRTKYSHP